MNDEDIEEGGEYSGPIRDINLEALEGQEMEIDEKLPAQKEQRVPAANGVADDDGKYPQWEFDKFSFLILRDKNKHQKKLQYEVYFLNVLFQKKVNLKLRRQLLLKRVVRWQQLLSMEKFA